MSVLRAHRKRDLSLWLAVLVVAAELGAGSLSAQTTPNLAIVRDVAGREFTGQLSSLSTDELVLDGRGEQTWPIRDLLRVDFPEHPTQRIKSGSVVYLANGDRLKVRPMTASSETLGADWADFPLLQSIDIALATIQGIVFQIPQSQVEREALDRALLLGTQQSDVLMLANGDRASGEFVNIDERAVAIEVPVGEIKIERDGIQALRFNTDLISFPQPETPLVLVSLVDGSRLTGRNAEVDKQVLRLDALFGEQLKLPISVVSSLQFLNGRGVYLSDIEPLEYRFTPFLSYTWELQRDRNVDGGPLLLRGAEFAKGLGTHSRCAVTYSLKGRYRLFHAIVGIDDSTDGKGNAAVSVELDGRVLFASDTITGNDPALAVPALDVSQGERLTLIVDFGQLADVGDRVNWCDAVLVE